MVTVVVTGHSSSRSPPPRWTPTGNGLQRGQFCWPPLGKTVGRQRAATWPPLGRISWPPTPEARDGTGDMRALRSPLTAPPVVIDIAEQPTSPRRGGVETDAVVEHPNLPVSPIATAYDLIEPNQEFRRTVAPGVPLACDRYRGQIRDTGEWDPDVVVAFIWRESLCNERAVSPTNDWGLLQINATCWAGKGIDGLPNVRQLPEGIEPEGLQCDGVTEATAAAEWCFHAKEQVRRTGRRPDSPCDAWLDPATNLRTAYEMWRVRGWQPWCFDASSRETPACRAAEAADRPQPEEH